MGSLEVDLRQFTGTERWYRWSSLFPRFLLTDGAKYLADRAGAYWLMDIIGSYQHELDKEGFQVWRLEKTGTEAVVVCDDGNGNVLAKQEIPYTNFPMNKVELYAIYSDNQLVILLPSEY
jgi:hypothetical protein